MNLKHFTLALLPLAAVSCQVLSSATNQGNTFMGMWSFVFAWMGVTTVTVGVVHFLFSGDTNPFKRDGVAKAIFKCALLCFLTVFVYGHEWFLGIWMAALIIMLVNFIGAMMLFQANFLQVMIIGLLNFVMAMYAVYLSERFTT